MADYALGADLSHWQDDPLTPQGINFNVAKAAGVSFVFLKASQGNWTDRTFIRNWAAAKEAGLLRGAYHYLDWRYRMNIQANHFAALLRDDPGELPPVCDYESKSNVPSAGSARLRLKEFLLLLEDFTGATPMLYTSPGFWAEFGSADAYWARYPLWIAHYTWERAPSTPKPWMGWLFWQYTDKGDGLAYGAESKQIDLNRFNGDLTALYEAYAGCAPPPVSVPLNQWAREVHAYLVSQFDYSGLPPEEK